MKGSALEAIEKINVPFSLHWRPGNPGYWEAVMGEEEVRASSPDVAIAIVIERYQGRSEDE
jgi:hypothetical protein